MYSPTSTSVGYDLRTPLVQAGDGNFYGVLEMSGANTPSIVRISPSGAWEVLFRFPPALEAGVLTGLTVGADGNLYGVATSGGSASNFHRGFIFKLTPFGEFTQLHTFSDPPEANGNSADGFSALGELVLGSDGNFYGVSAGGGASLEQAGTIFKITPAGKFTTLYSFCESPGSLCGDGSGPAAGLVQGSDGNFYGTTDTGGEDCPASTEPGLQNRGCGEIFRISPTGDFSVLHRFDGTHNGAFPESRLVEGADGNFYSVTNYGPGQIPNSQNTPASSAYKVTPSGEVTVLYVFPGGGFYNEGLFLGSDGSFYGTASSGGDPNCLCGYIYVLSPAGKAKDIYNFLAGSFNDGDEPLSPPLQAADGNFYGTTYGGGPKDYGTVYKLAPNPAFQPPVALSLSKQSIDLGEPVTLDWSVANAYSMTMQQCYASVQGLATGAGNWTGLQTGTFNAAQKPPYSGSAIITPTANGTFTYALTCGGMESGFATLTVGNQAASPGFYPPGGAYSGPQSISIVDSTPGASIYYTLDGSTPTNASTHYTAPIAIAKNTTLKAIAVAASLENSSVATAAYTILLPQTIAFTQPPSPQTFGANPLTLVATASSGLPVTFSIVSGPGAIAGSTLTIAGAGTIVVAANQSGNELYSAAPQVTHNVVVNKASQTIAFTQPTSPVAYGVAPITLAATATSGLPVTFNVLSGPAKVSGSTLTVTGVGTVTVGAFQNGNADYLGATKVSRSITVDKAAQSIAFTPPASPVTYGAKPIALSAKATSGLPVSYSVLSGPAKVIGSTLTITGAGTVVVGANQAGNVDYNPAAKVLRTIVVNKAKLTVTATSLSMKQGASVPTLTYAMTGFVNGDTQAKATTGAPVLSTAATSNSAPGNYPITIKAGTLAATNYAFTFVNGTLTVTK